MDKKKLYQKELLKAKIQENNNAISKLQIEYDELNSISKNHINVISSTTTSSTTSTTTSTTNTLKILIEKKLYLENKLKNLKKIINELSYNISKLEDEYANSTYNIKDKLIHEETIYNDELERIENDKIEAGINNIQNINDATLNKEDLLKEINLIKSNLQMQNDIILNLQIKYHSSRKNILNNLKEKKQQKINLNNNINDLNVSKNSFIEKLNNLNTDIENLIDFKRILIDAEYNIEYNVQQLNDYYEKYSINTTISLNDKISLIENIINNCKNQIILLQKQQNRTDISQTATIKENINKYHKNTNNKVITYKETFTIEKLKTTKIETVLEDKLNLYNNYESIIIDKIKNDYKDNIKELELDTKKALERLEITKKRINLDFNNYKIILKNKIETSKVELQNLYAEITTTNNDNNLLTITIEKETKIDTEMTILENKIKKHKDIIIQSEKDLLSLSE